MTLWLVNNAKVKKQLVCFLNATRITRVVQLLGVPIRVVVVQAGHVPPVGIKKEDIMNYQNKKVLISGGSSGIGLSLAKQLTSAGADVCILARREALLKSAQKELLKVRTSNKQEISFISADVGNFKELERALKGKIDHIDILINSAGIAYPGEFADLEPEIFANVMQVNYLGTVYLTKLIVPKMIAQKSGYIINISSLAALIGIYGYTAYAPSKYAIRGFSRCLRSELKAFGIDVSVVLPPDTDTPQLAFEHSIIPEITRKINENGGVMSPDKVAQIIIRGIDKKKFTIVPGLEGKLLYVLASIFGRYFYHVAVREHRKILKD